MKVFNPLFKAAQFPPQSLETDIPLIPKPDKDYSLFYNLCLISLIGMDLRMYAKVLANKIQPFHI